MPARVAAVGLLTQTARVPLAWITWKTPGVLLLIWNFWHNKSIHAVFGIVKAVVLKSYSVLPRYVK